MALSAVPRLRGVPRIGIRRPAARVALVLALLVLAAGIVAAVTRVGGTDAAAGGPAPTFKLDDVRSPGTAVSLDSGRPAVVNFFAAWCIPCRKELPVLEQAHRRSAGAVAFVGIDVNDSRTAAADLLDAAGVTFPAGYDPDRSVAGRYRVKGMPTTVFVDGAGRVAGVARGALTAAELGRRIDGLRAAGRVGTP